ncbi:Scr1 family TA system antitoxin-like transcriptional regulator [Longispora sp. NPDC051575]|uniref:Scr1 family TA system antitoxin-like transcriptional regulator n=1 Tax=Longispora sp. NPDC051575 TaxID=3154943 RepID=UPI00341E3BFB
MPARSQTPARLGETGRLLRHARKLAKLTQAELAALLRCSVSKILRIESGQHGVSWATAQAILTACAASANLRAQVETALEPADGGDPWAPYPLELTGTLRRIITVQETAARLRVWSIPPPEILAAGTIAAGWTSDPDPDTAARRADLLRLRQHRLWADAHRTIDAIVCESTVHAALACAEQMRHLADLQRHHRLTLRVVPYGVGAHRGMRGGLMLADLDPTGRVAHLLDARGGVLVDDRASLDYAEAVWRDVTRHALPPHHVHPAWPTPTGTPARQ